MIIRFVLKTGLPALFFIHSAFANVTISRPDDSLKTTIKINLARPLYPVSPLLYGLMTEEINHSYDGGLYAELIQNRAFKDDTLRPVHWALGANSSQAEIALDRKYPLNDSLPISLKLSAPKASVGSPVSITNDGFWGIPVRPATLYKVSFYARTDRSLKTAVQISLTSSIGQSFGGSRVELKGKGKDADEAGGWQRYEATLQTLPDFKPTSAGQFNLTVSSPGTVWLTLVSLFPPTYHGRKNGNRTDLMEKLATLNPKFLRLPGGNYVEGNSLKEFYNWKKTLHQLSVRPGHRGTWNYRSSDGLGLLEYLEWCEDLRIEPVLAVFAGYALNKEYVKPGSDLDRYVADALDEIEYATGDVKTKWGAMRSADGHPAPFPLHYVEIGNEDWFDKSGSYDGRFAQFYDAIKKKYPSLQIIATTGVKLRKPDVMDEHFYKRPQEFERDVAHYDRYSRSGPKVFVGEWASRTGSAPTPNMNCALGDAAWMTGMERNTDLIIMASYAPLFVNVNPGAMQWKTNMIGYDALNSYGSPSYYAQQMFYQNLGNVVPYSEITGVKTVPFPEAPPKASDKKPVSATPPKKRTMPTVSYSVTQDSKSGMVYLKVVNILDQPQIVRVSLEGGVPKTSATVISMKGELEDTNTISEPEKIKPVTMPVELAGANFDYTFDPHSVTVMKISTHN